MTDRTNTREEIFDVIVVGAGHAGAEAALAAARMGARVLLLTMNLDTICQMSCNPAIGGLAKGQLVREIDALGGEMGKAIDATGIHFKMLNTSKGPAVQSPRAQADKLAYQRYMRRKLEEQEGLTLRQEVVESIITIDGHAGGVLTKSRRTYLSKAVILTTGTFLSAVIHMGENCFPGGRAGELSAEGLSDSLRRLGFPVGRLKTGTPPRINARSIDLSRLNIQKPDEHPTPFSFSTQEIRNPQVPCYITHTNPRTHEIVRRNLHRAPLYTGQIKSIGPRYCPSLETKIVRFPEKTSHQVFLEPEGLDTLEVYCNGISTSIPQDVQEEVVHSIEGLERAEIMRYGYAVEYDFVPPTELKSTLETKRVPFLFHAGQINGTSGYEEAAAQGIIAGINAVLRIRGEKPFVLDRSEAYIGVMVDDLVTLGVDEPYRLFTSRAEYRLLLRHDNADRRLMKYGYQFGLVSDSRWRELCRKESAIHETIEKLHRTWIGGKTLAMALKVPGVTFQSVSSSVPALSLSSLPRDVQQQVEIEVKYEGYIERQKNHVERFKKLEDYKVPEDMDYWKIPHLRHETRERLSAIRPISLGQASRISGVTPADISVLMTYLGVR